MIRILLIALVLSCGIEGPPGPPGPQGEPGAGLVGQTICSGASVIGEANIIAAHRRYDFADGSALVSCEIFPSNGIERRKDSAPLFFKNTDVDWNTGWCYVNHSVSTPDGNGSGRFVFNITPGAAQGQVVYQDLSGPHHGVSIPLSCQSPY